MGDLEIRWHQRLSNYSKALKQLNKAVKLSEQRKLTNLEQQGIIQSFEYTHELAWNAMKDFIQSRGNTPIMGSKDATREAFKIELIKDGTKWMEMIDSRNRTTHTYHQLTANKIVKRILKSYIYLFMEFQQTMVALKNNPNS